MPVDFSQWDHYIVLRSVKLSTFQNSLYTRVNKTALAVYALKGLQFNRGKDNHRMEVLSVLLCIT